MDIQVLWQEVQKEGEKALSEGKTPDNNPYPYSEDEMSPYQAWRIGWQEADNASVEYNAG